MVISLVFAWGFGIFSLSGFAFWLRDWRTLQLAISVPNFAMCLIAFWYVHVYEMYYVYYVILVIVILFYIIYIIILLYERAMGNYADNIEQLKSELSSFVRFLVETSMFFANLGRLKILELYFINSILSILAVCI